MTPSILNRPIWSLGVTASPRHIRRGSTLDRALTAQARAAELGERALRHARAGDWGAAHRDRRKAEAKARRARELAHDAQFEGMI